MNRLKVKLNILLVDISTLILLYYLWWQDMNNLEPDRKYFMLLITITSSNKIIFLRTRPYRHACVQQTCRGIVPKTQLQIERKVSNICSLHLIVETENFSISVMARPFKMTSPAMLCLCRRTRSWLSWRSGTPKTSLWTWCLVLVPISLKIAKELSKDALASMTLYWIPTTRTAHRP